MLKPQIVDVTGKTRTRIVLEYGSKHILRDPVLGHHRSSGEIVVQIQPVADYVAIYFFP